MQRIKRILTTRPILRIYDPSLPTELHTDASSVGFGAMLLQIKDKKPQVVAYYSKQTTPEQKFYHSYELETLAVVLALRYFRTYLIGLEFKVLTDCSALRTSFTKKDLLPRVARWWLEVQDFNFKIEYRPGTKMVHVDALSRNLRPEIDVCQIDLTEGDWLEAAQAQDDQLSRIRQILESGREDRETKQYFQEYTVKKGKVYRKLEDGTQKWVVPRDVRWQICRLNHDDMGHFGAEKTLKKIRENYWFANMGTFVKKYVNACLNCTYYKGSSGKKQGMLYPIEKVPTPFHTLHVDHLGPFVTSRKGNKFLLVMVDAYTKFVILEPVKDTKTRRVTKALMDLMHLFGAPNRLITDRGSAFTSKTFETFVRVYGIKHILNAVATPRANGQCERYNRVILNALATTTAGHSEDVWDTFVKQVQSAINCTVHKATSVSPIEVLAGYKARNLADAKIVNEVEENLSRLDLRALRREVSIRLTKDQEAQKKRFDKARAVAAKYNEGDVVMVLKTDAPATGTSRKLLPKFKGPFKVTKVLCNDRYEVKDLREGHKQFKTVVAVDKLKPWVLLRATSVSN